MSIAQMNYLSILFYFMAGIFGALAAILYVAFDIRYIWKALRGNSFYRLKANPSRKERIKATEKLNKKQQNATIPIQEKTESLHSDAILLDSDICPGESNTIPLKLANTTYPIKNSMVPLEEVHSSLESYTVPLESANSIFSMENSTIPLQGSTIPLESATMNLIQNIVYIDSNEAIPL